MPLRLIAIASTLILATGPMIAVARVAEHAHEHSDAHSGHSHHDEETPHHDHGSDGDPLPAVDRVTAFTPRFSNDSITYSELFGIQPLAEISPLTGLESSPSRSMTPNPFPRPPGLSPGYATPLLI